MVRSEKSTARMMRRIRRAEDKSRVGRLDATDVWSCMDGLFARGLRNS